MKENIFACIASIPSRQDSLVNTIHSLLSQVDKIYLYLNNYSEPVAEQIKSISPVKIEYVIGDNSHGDAGKFHWADRLNGYIALVDDDLIYPADYIQSMIGGIEKYKRKAIVCFHGRITNPSIKSYYRDWKNYLSYNQKTDNDTFVHIAGTGVMGWHSASFKISMSDFPSPNMADIHASIFAQKNKIPIVVLKHEANWINGTYSPDNSIASSGMKNDKEQTDRVNDVNWRLYNVALVRKSSSLEISPATAYVINLAHRTDRYKSVFSECAKNNIIPIRIEAVNGRGEFKNIAPSPLLQSHYGCTASHIKALETALQSSNDYSMIIEDDCVLLDSFREKLKTYTEQLPSDWDLLYLGGSLINKPIYQGGELINKDAAEKYSENIYTAKKVLTTHACIVKNKSIPKLLEVIKSRRDRIDVLFQEFQSRCNCFIVYPELAWQRAGHSDIVGVTTNNTHLRYGSK